MQRAIITANYSSFLNEHGKGSEEITLDDLMYYSLYWDKIIIPFNRGIYGELPQESDFINSGAILRPEVSHQCINGSDIQSIASIELIEVYKVYKEKNPNFDFAIHHNVKNMFDGLNYPNLLEKDAIRLELTNLLPYPSNTNIYDLLNFKEKRKSELNALHTSLNDLYINISKSGDAQEIARLQAISYINQSLDDLKRVMNESFKDKIFSKNLITDLKSDFKELGSTAIADAFLTTFPTGTISDGIKILTKRVITTIMQEQKTDPVFNYIKSSIKDGVIDQNFRP